MISDPLHRDDCCLVTDGGGAAIVTTPEIAKRLKRPLVRVMGHGESQKGQYGGKRFDLIHSGAVRSGPVAFAAAAAQARVQIASMCDLPDSLNAEACESFNDLIAVVAI